MKVTVGQKQLEAVLGAAAGLAGKDRSLPILGHVLIEARDGRCTLTATDLAAGLRAPVEDARVEEEGALSAPARVLHDLVKTLDGEVTLEALKSRLKVTAGTVDVKLPTLDAAEFPAWPTVEGVEPVEVEASALSAMVERTAWAAAGGSEQREALRGLLVEASKGRMHVVATNGHVLAVSSVPTEAKNLRRIVPAPALRSFTRLVNPEARARLFIGENHMLMRAGELEFMGRYIAGVYPNWRGVVPTENPVRVRAGRAELFTAISRAALVAQGPVTLELNGAIKVEARSDLGEVRDSVPAEVEGGNVTVRFNASYLMEALRHLPEDGARLFFGDIAATITTEEGDYQAVVAQMK